MLSGWCRTRVRRARLVSNAFLYTTSAEIFEISETALFSADLLWDFNPGSRFFLRNPTLLEWLAGRNTQTQNTQAQNTHTQNTQSPELSKPKNTQTQNTQSAKIPKIEIAILIK